MPKKKKGKEGKKKGKEKEEKAVDDGPPKPYEPPGASSKEIALKKELEDLDDELSSLKQQVQDFIIRREENEWLQKEAEQTKQETDDYQTYLSRRADKRQSLIISLNDYNQQQLKEIAAEKEHMLREHEERKAGLNSILLEKENELAKVQDELASLEPYKALKDEQDKELEDLEKEIEEQKFAHEEKIRAMRVQLVKDQRAAEMQSKVMIKEVSNRINKQASECMERQTRAIKQENVDLRRELRGLIELTSAFQEQKTRLEKQYKALKHEHQFNYELNWLRGPVFRGAASSDLNLGGRSSP